MKLKSLILAATLLLFSGCGVLAEREPLAQLTVQYATMKFVEQAPPEETNTRSCRIKQVVEDTRGLLAGEGVTISLLEQAVLKQLPTSLSPADRFLATALIQQVVGDLNLQIGEGLLDPEKKLYVNKVLGWVEMSVVCL